MELVDKTMRINKLARLSLAALVVAASGCFAGNLAPVEPALGPDQEKVAGLPEGMGQLRINIKWPARSIQGIPLSARKLKFRIKQGAALKTSREVDQTTTTTAFNLRAGAYDLEVGAHPGTVDGTDYSATEIAAATTSVVIYSSVATTAGLAMKSNFEPQLGTFDDEAFVGGSNFSIPGSSNLTLGWAPSLPVITFPKAGGTGTATASVTVVGGNLTFSVPPDADPAGSFTITQDGISKSFPYSQGATTLKLTTWSSGLDGTDADGVPVAAPAGQGGATCTVSSSGAWSYGGWPTAWTEANGYAGGFAWNGSPRTDLPSMRLLVLRGNGVWESVGANRTFTTTSGESLNFRANDCAGCYWNNRGSQSISMTCNWNKTGTFTVSADSSTGTQFTAPGISNASCRFTAATDDVWSNTATDSFNASGSTAVLAAATDLFPAGDAGALIVKRGDGTWEMAGVDRAIAIDSGEVLRFQMNGPSGARGSGFSGSVDVNYTCATGSFGFSNITVN